MIQSISEAETYLAQFVAKTSATTGKDVTVERMWPLLERAGNPQDRLRVIHVAGTSGKTSTAYFVAALLKESAQKVGLTVSPHVSSLTERLQINCRPVAEREFCELLNQFISVMGTSMDASYFEFLIVFILWSFVQLQVDYAVVETGLGGLHDATNIFKQADKICVITDIGLDHQHVLGNTVSEIALQKAGIIQKGNSVFMYKQSPAVRSVIVKKCRDVSAKLRLVEYGDIRDSKLPLFQKRNWLLAKLVYDYVQDRDGLDLLSLHSLSKSEVSVPGRMQEVQSGNQLFVLDGAHNVQKMNAFVNSFKAMYPDVKAPVLLAIKKDKDYEKVIQTVLPIMSQVFCTDFSIAQDMPIEFIPSDVLIQACKTNGISQAEKCTDIEEAVLKMKNLGAPVNIITGSFYILGDAVKKLK